MDVAYLKTPIGLLEIKGDFNGLAYVGIAQEHQTYAKVIPSSLQEAYHQLQAYFDGNRQHFELKLNPQGTSFQRKVWTYLLEIPFGKTISYLQLSQQLGNEKAIRAVAAANGKNPLLIICPCHRVIGSNGALTGYSAGLWRKQWLLEHENSTTQGCLF